MTAQFHTLLLAWHDVGDGYSAADPLFHSGEDGVSYSVTPLGAGWVGVYDGEVLTEILATPQDAAWAVSMHVLRDLREYAGPSSEEGERQRARRLLDAIARASVGACEMTGPLNREHPKVRSKA